MCKRIALFLLLASSAVHAIDPLGRMLQIQCKWKMQLLLKDDQGSDLLVLPDDVKKHILGFVICLIKEDKKLSNIVWRLFPK